MDIRTKLVFALVALALGSMLTLGAFMYVSADRKLNKVAEDQLQGLAESRKEGLEKVVTGWRERVQLIASRTQLRISLSEYNRTGDLEELSRIERILGDALAAVDIVTSLAVRDPAGRLVARVGAGASAGQQPVPPLGAQAGEEVRFLGVSFDADRQPQVRFLADLVLEGETVGSLDVVLDGGELVDLTRDFTGLGDTGEVLIVMREESGAWTLHPVRHGEQIGDSGPIRLEGVADPVLRALDGQEGVYTRGLTDYREAPVWAATRRIPDPAWGLVVKVDVAEQQASITEFREELTDLALSLAAFAILVAALLGFRFAGPIHHLSEVANRIRVGELEARATVETEDEIGLLARTFNQMADELEERMELLHEFQKFFEVSLDMLCIAATDGYFKKVNPAFERTLGWTTEQLLGRPFFDLVHPDDLEPTQKEIEKLAQGIPTISFVNRFRCADGTYKYLRWTSHPEPETGLLYAVAREIQHPQAS